MTAQSYAGFLFGMVTSTFGASPESAGVAGEDSRKIAASKPKPKSTRVRRLPLPTMPGSFRALTPEPVAEPAQPTALEPPTKRRRISKEDSLAIDEVIEKLEQEIEVLKTRLGRTHPAPRQSFKVPERASETTSMQNDSRSSIAPRQDMSHVFDELKHVRLRKIDTSAIPLQSRRIVRTSPTQLFSQELEEAVKKSSHRRYNEDPIPSFCAWGAGSR
ncbi:hypothetical protein DACRYDRAFT_112327 [Dacryopinax primogenitus]|uniref:Uncharacterized protein n=1 Tax=Dacryopinax primogenitus (strain DJM 731) TaxID=1858805 RepID=M5FZQ9_DACPD|nr:uncharacterized protein DACRYDRAFT_112327 [Dacryopinax primogenitus]EJT96997.1 hypothetical protein DACRYDRAFT_112327 [Dacryopinax primogenitus]